VTKKTKTELDALLDGAEAHGIVSEPDHEVGDLRDVLATAWALLTMAQRRAVVSDHAEVIAWGMPEERTPDQGGEPCAAAENGMPRCTDDHHQRGVACSVCEARVRSTGATGGAS